MTSFYPGSKQKVKTYETPVKPEPPDEDLTGGREFMVGNSRVTLYKVGALAKALRRKPGTVRKWESDGIIPPALYLQPSSDPRGSRRLYSKDQIDGLRKIAEEEGILNPSAGGKWSAIEETKFREKAVKLFRELS